MKVSLSILAAAATALMLGSPVMADHLILDRGLPTANLNDAAGSNRSNVAWSDEESAPTPSMSSPDVYLPGDDFTLGGSYHVDDIRVWTTTDPSTTSLSLRGGLSTSTSFGTISGTPTVTDVTYNNGEGYQASSGSFDQIYQLDFAVNLDLSAGQKFDFFLDSPYQGSGTTYTNAYLLASNAALSGSPQDSEDNLFQYLHINGANQDVEPFDSAVGGYWDKSSDGNVQVYGTATPLPSSAEASLALLGILGVAGLRKRRAQPTV